MNKLKRAARPALPARAGRRYALTSSNVSLASRLARIEGQVRGIKRMLEEDAYCDDVMAQIAAARGALGKASLAVLDHHMKHCLIDHVKAGDDSIIDELIDSIARNF
ncbi:hypothetical protein MASR2M48_31350 [Spirochaetota bacterium]